jgi:aspartate kinase
METVVMKYGGSSLATVEKIQAVANRVVERWREGAQIAVVVSAMGSTTNEYLQMAETISTRPCARELDVLLTAGEQVSISLLALALKEQGAESVSLTGRQAGFITDGCHSRASILEMKPQRVLEHLQAKRIAVVAGFQGISTKGDITTLGRGGSDTSAVALAAAIKADRCEIYSDVDGVYSADPRTVPAATLLSEVNYDEMLEFARHGARVLKTEAVETARRYEVTLSARSSFKKGNGTLVRRREGPLAAGRVLGVTGRNDLIRLALKGDSPPPDFHQKLSECELLYSDPGSHGFGLVLSSANIGNTENFVEEISNRYKSYLDVSTDYGAVSAVGEGIGCNSKVGLDIYERMRSSGLPFAGSYLTPHSVTYLVPNDNVKKSVGMLHGALVEEKVLC